MLLILMMLSIWIYKANIFKDEVWRIIHFLNYLIFPLAYLHSFFLGSGVKSSRLLQIEWIMLGSVFLIKGLLFIAGGIGITPFLSMLRYLCKQQSHRIIWLIWGNKTLKDIAFRDELEEMKRDLGGLKIVHVLSEEKVSDNKNGFIDADKVKDWVGDLNNKEIFICGPPIMTNKIIKGLRRMNISKERIHSERFLM